MSVVVEEPRQQRPFRSFFNGHTRLIFQQAADGSWDVEWLSSQGIEHVTNRFADDDALREWSRGKGRELGFAEELYPESKPEAKKKSPSRIGKMSAQQRLLFQTRVAEWMRSTFEIHGGPGEPDFDLAFEAQFGFSWDEWSALRSA